MFFYGVVLVICHTIVWFTYKWMAGKPLITAGDTMSTLAIGFMLGFIVAIVAFAPSGKSDKEKIDDIFRKD